MKERQTGPIIAAVVAIPLLLFGAYMGSYYALLEKNQLVFGRELPAYRIENKFVRRTFAPAHQVDRLVRPRYWGPWGYK